MSRQTLPANQQRHDNVSVVRLKTGGCRFEIACYRNKAQSYRNNVEKDIGEVLQIERVFTNVSQGEFAKIEDVRKHLGPKIKKSKTLNDEELERAATLLILDTGVIQLNEKERQAELDGLLHDVATFIAEKSVHPETRRPYPVSMVLSSLQSLGFAPSTKKPAKTQALEAMKQLSAKGILQLERAPMLIRGTFTSSSYQACLDNIQKVPGVQVVNANFEKLAVEFMIPPDTFRAIDALVKDMKGGSLQVLVTAVAEGHEVEINEATVAKDVSPKGKKVEKAEEREEAHEVRGKKTRRAKKGRGQEEDEEVDGIGKLLAGALDLSSEDEGKGKGKKKKGRKKAHQSAAPKEEKKKEKKKEEEEEEEDDDFLTGKKKIQAEKEEREKKRVDEQLRADPNYYDSDQFGSDYSDFYNNSDEDLDINEIHQQKEAKKKQKQEEEEKRKEEEEKAKPKVRETTKKKKKQRNKKGEVLLSSDSDE